MSGRYILIRILVVLTFLLGGNYIVWRWLESVNWSAWWIAVPLVVAETYSVVDTWLFCLTMWRARERPGPLSDPTGTVDVLITTYNEPLDMVMRTAKAAQQITYPHSTWILDDGSRPELREAAEAAGIKYITRSDDWIGKPRHAKAGNLNSALFQTDGEFILILDADQVPDPLILHRTLGYFADDPDVALVQTPQWFGNVDGADTLGSQAPLFYGPIQQGKDGWNAAFFCGSNAVLRRDALLQLGIVGYVQNITDSTMRTLRLSGKLLAREIRRSQDLSLLEELTTLRKAMRTAQLQIKAGEPIAEVTFELRELVDAASHRMLERDMTAIQGDLDMIAGLTVGHESESGDPVLVESILDRSPLIRLSPVASVAAVGKLLAALRIDRSAEAQPILPMATISVTEDMATAMQLHALGWRSIYHHETLAIGLAPEDLRTMLTQRLRWAQGTLQVMLRDNPLIKRGLSIGQRLMYFSTMWTYLSGFAALVYFTAPFLYIMFGVLPVTAWSGDFFSRFIPAFVVNQLLFLTVARGVKTWRGQQYSLALFPVWIQACWTAFANVVLKRPLNFAVTRKDGINPEGVPWRQIWPQLLVMVLLVMALLVGVLRTLAETADGLGTMVNTVWLAYDLLVLGVIIKAVNYRGPAARGRAWGETT